MPNALRKTSIDQAIHWFAKRRGDDLSDIENRDFQSWLQESLANRRAYEEVTRLWGDIGTLEPVSVHVGGVFNKGRQSRWRPFAAAIAACLVLAVCTLGILLGLPSSGKVYQTAVGEQRTLYLEDGSTVFLNTDSIIKVKLKKQTRTVRLQKGEALFDVARNENRPFTVETETGRVHVLGTRFNVRAYDAGTEVSVLEGHVKVSRANAIPDEVAASLIDGQGISVSKERLGEVLPINKNIVAAWKNRRLVFQGTALSRVVSELNRYLKNEVRIGEDALNDISVTAVIHIEDRSSILTALNRALPIETVTLPSGVTMLYAKKGA